MPNLRTAVKPILQNTALVVISILVALGGVELALAIEGRYNQLATQTLVASPAIYERTPNTTERTPHPDLAGVVIEARTDSAGVRNHSDTPTDRKRNIIGIFGDSYTENQRVEDRFTFTSLLDGATGGKASVVNFGVNGYGLDQAYLRYRKYEALDIKHVVYVFCANDLRNLYETDLVQVGADGEITFREPRPKWYRRALGRLRITYLALSAYHQIAGMLRGNPSTKEERAAAMRSFRGDPNAARQEARFHDATADAMAEDIVKEHPSEETLRWARTFSLVLRQWQREVTSRGRTFTVVVLPWDHRLVAEEAMQGFEGNVLFLDEDWGNEPFKFTNDGHWNEYGNLRAAEIIAASAKLPFHGAFTNPAYLNGWKEQIDEFYRSHGK